VWNHRALGGKKGELGFWKLNLAIVYRKEGQDEKQEGFQFGDYCCHPGKTQGWLGLQK